jgi:MtN3 and saliva related transmembrane protein
LSGVEILGLAAGAITTGGIVPQVMRVFKLRSAHDVSLLFTLLLLIGDSTWLVYGAILRLAPIILWNVFAVILLVILCYGKLKYGKEGIASSSSKK